MNRKPALITLMLFLISISSAPLKAQTVEASGTIYKTISDPIDHSIHNFRSSISQSSDPPTMEWSKTYVGYTANSVQQTIDYGYVFAGWDLVKVDATGNMQWNVTLDGYAYSVQQTVDGGYIIAGTRNDDGWLAKTHQDGNTQWNRSLGGDRSDALYSVRQTKDGGYISAGFKNEFMPMDQVWVVRTDSNGTTQWEKTFGGDGWNDRAFAVLQTDDEGFTIAGWTYSFGAENLDFLLLKVNSTGNEEWVKTFGGAEDQGAFSLDLTVDGGYILVGSTSSNNSCGILLVKTDENGNQQWNKTFGNNYRACANSVCQTSDGGFVLAGYIASSNYSGSEDLWVIRTNSLGEVLWNATFGGTENDEAFSVHETLDGGYIVGGYYGLPHGNSESWLIKLGADSIPEFPSFLIPPLLMMATLLAVIAYKRKRVDTM